MNKFLAIVLGAVVLSTGCKKEETTVDPPPPAQKTKKELLSASLWKMTGFTISAPSSGTEDYFATMKDCQKDDTWSYKTDGSYVRDEGPTKCYPSDPQSEQGSWSISGDEKKITIDGDEANIVTLTATDFVAETVDNSTGEPITIRMSFKH